MATQFPQKWNKYILLDELDSGGMADLYLGVYDQEKAQHSRLMVIKRIRESHKDVAEWMAMFKNEIQLLLCLQSPHIVQTFDFSVDEIEPYIVMEYIEGITLWQIFNDIQVTARPLSEAVCVELFKQVATGLRDAHNFVDPASNIKKPIIHKDISPHNILVGANGLVKVIDFGIAKSSISDYKTLITQIKGKPSYMSPEQISGDKELDCRSDMFSLGVCFWELLTGKRLFPTEGDPFLSVYKKFEDASFKVQNIKSLRPELSSELASILEKLLEKDKNKRFSNMDELLKGLQMLQLQRGLASGYELLKDCINDNFKSYINQQRDKAQEALKKYKLNNHIFVDENTVTQVSSKRSVKKDYFNLKWISFSALTLAIFGVLYLSYSVLSKKPASSVVENNKRPQRDVSSTGGERDSKLLLSDEERSQLREIYTLKAEIEKGSATSVKTAIAESLNTANKREQMTKYRALSKEERLGILSNALLLFKEISSIKDESLVLVKIRENKDIISKLPPPRSRMQQDNRQTTSE